MLGKKYHITKYEDAYEIARPYIDASKRMFCIKGDAKCNQVMDLFKKHPEQVPRHATSSRWAMTDEALQNTLKYIFFKLAHNCYMLCVDENGQQMYWIKHKKTSESFEKAVQDQLATLDSNKLITERQRAKIRTVAANPVRIMQCILKNYEDNEEEKEEEEGEEEKDAYTEQNEYVDLLKDLSLPYGVYILNLTDAVILHRSGREPFPMLTGDLPLSNEFRNTKQIPIFSISGQKAYSDIPIPNYDDMFIVMGMKDMKFDEYETDWSKKKYNKAVFRGGPSGCGYTTETNPRIRLAAMKSPLLDAKLIGKGKTIDSNSIKFDPVHGLGMLNTGIAASNQFMTMAEQSQYKYIIHVDGNVNAYRLLTTMMTGSLIIRVDGPYLSWVDQLIKPNVHYILVKADLSDLLQKIKWCEMSPKSAQKIAKAGYEFAKRALTREFVNETIEKTFWTVMPLVIKQRSSDTRKIKRKPKSKRKSPKSPAFSPPPSPIFSPKSPAFSPPPSPNKFVRPPSPDYTPPSSDSPPFVRPPSPDYTPPSSDSPDYTKPYMPPSQSDSPDYTKPPSPPLPSGEPPLADPRRSPSGSSDKVSPLMKPITPPIKKSKSPSSEEDIIELPPGAKKCPDGYKGFTQNGKKMCRRKTAKKAKSTAEK
jgi:hypothetical protein